MNVLIGFLVVLFLLGFAITVPVIGVPCLLLFILYCVKQAKSPKGKNANAEITVEQKENNKLPIVKDWHNSFGVWNKKRHHMGLEQDNRRHRSIVDDIEILAIDSEGWATIRGTKEDIYTTTLNSCSCPDFEERHYPCKHIYKLARELQNKQEMR